MSQFIDVYQPKLPVQHVKTAEDEIILSVIWALKVKRGIWARAMHQRHYSANAVQHRWQEAFSAIPARNKLLPYFLAADEARGFIIRNKYFPGCDRKFAIRTISSMLRKVGAKSNDERLEGIIELIENDGLADATGLWEPLHATPATLKLACDEVIANHTMGHLLTPAEFAVAHRKARHAVHAVEYHLVELIDFVRKCDAVLLHFAPVQWSQPYLLPQYQATRERMLEMHTIYSDTRAFSYEVEDAKRVWKSKSVQHTALLEQKHSA